MHSDPHFKQFGLSPLLLKAVIEKGYKKPTPIQAKAIPILLSGRDIMAAAQTGTGKTASFTLPILERLLKNKPAQANQARVLILAPTRELAAQIGESVASYGQYLSLRSMVVFGGVKINPQMQKLCRGTDILVATPGRLLDLYNQNAVKFKHLEVLVFDEADKLLDMGFIDEIRQILAVLPKKRQTLMFSATFSDEIREFAKDLLKTPVEISVSPRNTTAKTVKQWICPVDKKKKPALLVSLIKQNNWQQVLVFCKTKNGANKLTRYLEGEDITASVIHGDKSQGARTKALADFKQSIVQVLVATDIAARGLDIEQLPQVVNFDLPKVSQDYIHRIGRTGRAGISGKAISLVSADEFDYLTNIEHLLNILLTRKLIDGFEPLHDVPESHLWRKAKKPKKPKKPKVKPSHNDKSEERENLNNHGLPSKKPTKLAKTKRTKKQLKTKKLPSKQNSLRVRKKKSKDK